ncbi:hypothetical protein PPYR_07101 [Photinus pyralis]|uniref:Cytochrome P450 n=2 Tax=Photinus pyralis TaxID=7054 RepID=A0A5N4API7_PHOPY|nr:probable cytochrome P450 301a1, mitochondrial [Photinus pyralis]KAB0799221.1 hypothetical protein PPYR_07101 [Photinus pyralis]
MLSKATLLQVNLVKRFAQKYASANPLPSEPLTHQQPRPIIPEALNTHATSQEVITTKDFDRFFKLEQSIDGSGLIHRSQSFDSVPGPISLRYLSKFWKIIPAVNTTAIGTIVQYLLTAGSQLPSGRSAWVLSKWFDQYGPIVRLHSPFGGDIVVVTRAEYAAEVFRREGRYPMRSCLDCLNKYREYKCADRYSCAQNHSFIQRNGHEWDSPTVEDSTGTGKIETLKDICDEFVIRISNIRNRQDEVPSSFDEEIKKWSLECLLSAVVNKRLGFLNAAGTSPAPEPLQILKTLNKAHNDVKRCESGVHLWKFFDTPAWNSLIEHFDALGCMLRTHIYKTQESLERKKERENEGLSISQVLFVKEGLLIEDVLTVLFDMMLIGANGISHTVAFLMYNLARNPKSQRKFYEELKSIDIHDFSKMKYARACIRESLRLNPPMPFLNRVLSKDISVRNYLIPKGTHILAATHMCNLREEYFENANEFRPERWIEDDLLDTDNVVLPFDNGIMPCLPYRSVETQVIVLFLKLLNQFQIEYHYGEIRNKYRVTAEPKNSLKFRFVDRN